MGGWQGRQIVGWHDIDDLQRRMAPYVLRRLKEQCIDLPPKIDPVQITVPLDTPTWKLYKQMKDDMVTWLNEADVSAASQAIVKAMRLAQITSGFIGGVERQEDLLEFEDKPDFVEGNHNTVPSLPAVSATTEIGREKLDAFLNWLQERLEEDPQFKVLVWGRFRPEVHRLYAELEKFPEVQKGLIIGGQKKTDREYALRLLDPRTTPEKSVVVVGTPSTGSMGLNLTAANTVVYLSNDFSLKTRLQSEDRVHRPGQVRPVSYFDIVATGPNGQKTIDHTVVKALITKEELANFTTSAWLQALEE
jgi:hypothetical protein